MDSADESNIGIDRLLVELDDGKSLVNVSVSAWVGFLTLLIMLSAVDDNWEFCVVFQRHVLEGSGHHPT